MISIQSSHIVGDGRDSDNAAESISLLAATPHDPAEKRPRQKRNSESIRIQEALSVNILTSPESRVQSPRPLRQVMWGMITTRTAEYDMKRDVMNMMIKLQRTLTRRYDTRASLSDCLQDTYRRKVHAY